MAPFARTASAHFSAYGRKTGIGCSRDLSPRPNSPSPASSDPVELQSFTSLRPVVAERSLSPMILQTHPPGAPCVFQLCRGGRSQQAWQKPREDVEVGVAVPMRERAWVRLLRLWPLRVVAIHNAIATKLLVESSRLPFALLGKYTVGLGWLAAANIIQVLINALGGQMTDYDNKPSGLV